MRARMRRKVTMHDGKRDDEVDTSVHGASGLILLSDLGFLVMKCQQLKSYMSMQDGWVSGARS
jgi:hypothetical protein